MIRTFLHLDLKPGRREDVIEWYKETGALERAVREAGCLSTEIYPDPENDDRLLVTALWNSAADYDGWVPGGIGRVIEDMDFRTAPDRGKKDN